MLQNLYVKNLALIREADIAFGEGVNILTGETGAGKSMIVDSAALALGSRYRPEMLRAGADYGVVELQFSVENEALSEKLAALEIFPEEGMVILSRRFIKGRTVSKINGETVSLTQIKKAAALLIHMYGQSEHHQLLNQDGHLQILDDLLGDEVYPLRKEVQEAFCEASAAKAALAENAADATQRHREADLLSFELNEIEEAQLTPGEDETLEAEFRRMTLGKRIREQVYEARSHTCELPEQNASDALSRAVKAMSAVADFDEKGAALYEQIIEIDSLLNDLNRELADYGEDFSFSPEAYTETENRLNEINRLKAKYGTDTEGILAAAEEKRERLDFLETYEASIQRLTADFEKKNARLSERAAALSAIRKAAAPKLSEILSVAISELNFAEAVFEISFGLLSTPGEKGADDVTFLISMNPGTPPAPLSAVASGGELSRIMLAIKTVLAKKEGVETIILDEIDTGISGRTAAKVAEKIALLGQHHQVICITHLAQIAAVSDVHFLIEKEVSEGETKTGIRALNEEEGIMELARISGGEKLTRAVLVSAREMRGFAKQMKIGYNVY